MDSLQIFSDSLDLTMSMHKVISTPQTPILDYVYKIATVIIAFINLCFAVYIFIRKNKRDDSISEKNRKVTLLQSLILSYNMCFFYEFIDKLGIEATKLKVATSIEQKRVVNDSFIYDAKILRIKFIDTLRAVDVNLYQKVLEQSDALTDNLTNAIFDEGINLTHEPKFEEMITSKISIAKTNILQLLINYKGE